ncbi:MAG: hypothetical protein HEP71_30465 [Roseivirga sp.]|nr:hypothetical protein [Roseivirga sp.]
MKRNAKAGFDTNKDLIVNLIQADLKHNQLISGLGSLDLHTDSHFLGLHRAVSQLMGIEESRSDQWFAIYDTFLENAHKHPISDNPNHLLTVAQECYDLLCACIKIESHLNPKD